jgi:hypothetical protein
MRRAARDCGGPAELVRLPGLLAPGHAHHHALAGSTGLLSGVGRCRCCLLMLTWNSDLSLFLRFITGRKRLPVRFSIALPSSPVQDTLPGTRLLICRCLTDDRATVATTCACILYLPSFSSLQVSCRSKLVSRVLRLVGDEGAAAICHTPLCGHRHRHAALVALCGWTRTTNHKPLHFFLRR